MSKEDPEKLTKDRLRKLDEVQSEFSVLPMPIEHVRFLLNRLEDYRARIKGGWHKFHKKLHPLQKEIADQKMTLSMARQRLDPESHGTHYSQVDQYEVGEHIRAIEKIRGRIVAHRLIYGQPVDVNNETEDVIKEALAKLGAEKAKYSRRLKEGQQKGI